MSLSDLAVRAASLAQRFQRIRSRTLGLCVGLSAEDMMVQSMPDASPAKWHLAHTTWFFEQFLLGRDPAWRPRHPEWHYLFNSYYQTVGPMHARPRRGLLSRPSLDEVLDYRRRIEEAVAARLHAGLDEAGEAIVELGLQHEQQHQELLLTDIQHALWCHPLHPAYDEALPSAQTSTPATGMRYVDGREGIVEIGHSGDGFCFDNEGPRHRTLLQAHALANRPVTNEEFRLFVQDGGYRESSLWLSDGWATVQAEGWQHPLYWQDDLDSAYGLGGIRALDPAAPVTQLSYFEADAFARWAGARLPTEAEWEDFAASADPMIGNQLDRAAAVAPQSGGGMFGDVWEWTQSAFSSYPGFAPAEGAVGEYNGKFMSGQLVLKGASCATPRGHSRASYRNFFPPHARWQFTGVRLARDC